MNNTCATCKWWKSDDHTLAISPQKECFNQRFIHENGIKEVADPEESLTYQHYEGGQFWTGANFGCVHHKKKGGGQDA